jgi:superfamily II DNA or RNA helicase
MVLDEKYKNKLYSYQIQNTINIIKIINKNNAVIDASDTGTGKTYSAIAACCQLKFSPIILCPKAVMSVWKKVCKLFDIKPFFIVNYETIKGGKYYINGERKKCPYIKYKKNEGDEKNKKNPYQWKLSDKDKIIFIFDEVHRCTNFNTYNGKLLISTKETNKPLIILSATLADKPEKIKIFAYMLNFIDRETIKNKNIDFDTHIQIIDKWLGKGDTPMIRVHNMLFPDRGTRMRIDELGDLFPETQILAIPYNIGKTKEIEIQHEYEKIADYLEKLKEKKNKEKGGILVNIIRSHQKIEILKIPIFIDLIHEFKEEGKSIAIFLNFTQTLKMLSNLLKTKCLIYGEQTDNERQKNIENFQNNLEKIILCNIKAGGIGISLHDLTGRHPRISLISPCWSSIDLTQVLGRIHRAGGKSKSLQRIIYTANTIEENIADKLQIKLKDINSLNNGDLNLTNIIFQKKN